MEDKRVAEGHRIAEKLNRSVAPAAFVLIVVGVVFLVVAGVGSPRAPNVSYLIGSFLPGLFCLIIGLKLSQTKKPARRSRNGDPEKKELKKA